VSGWSLFVLVECNFCARYSRSFLLPLSQGTIIDTLPAGPASGEEEGQVCHASYCYAIMGSMYVMVECIASVEEHL
jgi:hypothetical protein